MCDLFVCSCSASPARAAGLGRHQPLPSPSRTARPWASAMAARVYFGSACPPSHVIRPRDGPALGVDRSRVTGRPIIVNHRERLEAPLVSVARTGSGSSEGTDPVTERRRAVAFARHHPRLRGRLDRRIAGRVGRSLTTVKTYLCDPTGEKARAVKPQSESGDHARRRLLVVGKALERHAPTNARNLRLLPAKLN